MTWAWERGDKLIMLPDQHLGRNTAYPMGVPLDEMVIWDPDVPYGGLDRQAIDRARLILWKGHCSVHTRFTLRQIEHFRQQYPGGKVVVHPECTFEVAQAADAIGSTEFIIRTISDSPEGSAWAVGTEVHLVNRLADRLAPARTVVTLDSLGCLCSTMFRVSPNHLLWILEGLLDDEVHNRIVVPEPTKTWARVALDRMLDLSRKD
jgi:quinolinate synthase